MPSCPRPVRQHRPRDHPRPARGRGPHGHRQAPRRAARSSSRPPARSATPCSTASTTAVATRRCTPTRSRTCGTGRRELARALPPGTFGENLTTEGVDVTGAVIGEVWAVESADGGDPVLVQVTSPRIPCVTFQAWMGEAHWVRRFTEHGAPGAYLRVLGEGAVAAGAPLRGRRAAGARGHGGRGVPAAVRRPGPPAAAARPGRGPAPAARRPARRPGPPQRLSRAWPDTGLPDPSHRSDREDAMIVRTR